MPKVLGKLERPSARRVPLATDLTRKDVSAEFTYRHGGHELRLFVPAAAPRQVEAVNDGETEFALAVEEPAILLCVRFGDVIPWMAATFVSQNASRDPGWLPPPANSPHESRALLHVELVDATSGLTLAEQNVTLWLDFTRALNEAIREESRVPFHPVEHERAMGRLRRRYPTDDILAASSAVRSPGCR